VSQRSARRSILHFAATDGGGGAAKATLRLHQALRGAGHLSRLLVRHKQTDDREVVQVPYQFSVWRHRARRWRTAVGLSRSSQPRPQRMFNFDEEPDLDAGALLQYRPGEVDVIVLHWITDFLTVESIHRLQQHYRCPIVWLIMDQEPLTGGCHYSFDCEGYAQRCGNCPQITPSSPHDASRRLWERKDQFLRPLPVTLVAANSRARWLIEKSSLFGKHRIADIPVPVDVAIFRPFSRAVARDLLGIPAGVRVIFFGSATLQDPRKGMPQLQAALQLLAQMPAEPGAPGRDQIFLLVAGAGSSAFLEQLPFAGKAVGFLRDELTLALAYQAADLFVCPSVEDGGPMMIAESMLCGTPVVAFNSGMAPDLIETMRNGYLARYRDSADLAHGMRKLLSLPDLGPLRQAAAARARAAHAPDAVVAAYIKLFASLEGNEVAHAG
jgi:glycosyltransferase involved in cell wall biosynthesis